MAIHALIPNGGLVRDPEDNIHYNIPHIGLFQASPLPVPRLTLATSSNIGTTAATIGCTNNLVVDSGDILYWYISESATPPSKTDLKAGTSASAYGSDITVSLGISTFNASGLASDTTFYAHFLQSTTNGDSTILTSSSFDTLDPSDVFATAVVLNSLTSSESTVMTANVTTPNDVNYATTLFYYRLFGSSTWTSAGQGLPTANVTDDFEITGLSSGSTYELFAVARDSTLKQSVPSAVYSVTVGTVQSEEELFLDNLKELISQSSSFQTWTGTTNTTDAKAFIFKRWKDSPTGRYCLINLPSKTTTKMDNTNSWSTSSMSMILIDDTATAYETRNSEAELVTFSTTTGKMIVEMDALEGLNGNLVVEEFDIEEEHGFGDREYEDDDLIMMVKYNITTGV